MHTLLSGQNRSSAHSRRSSSGLPCRLLKHQLRILRSQIFSSFSNNYRYAWQISFNVWFIRHSSLDNCLKETYEYGPVLGKLHQRTTGPGKVTGESQPTRTDKHSQPANISQEYVQHAHKCNQPQGRICQLAPRGTDGNMKWCSTSLAVKRKNSSSG